MITWMIRKFDKWWLSQIDIGVIHDTTLYDFMMHRIMTSMLTTGKAIIGVDYAKVGEDFSVGTIIHIDEILSSEILEN